MVSTCTGHCGWLNLNHDIISAPCVEGEVQLIGNSGYSSFGRVEVCRDSTWGSVCGQRATFQDASVVCRQLGFSPHGMHAWDIII